MPWYWGALQAILVSTGSIRASAATTVGAIGGLHRTALGSSGPKKNLKKIKRGRGKGENR